MLTQKHRFFIHTSILALLLVALLPFSASNADAAVIPDQEHQLTKLEQQVQQWATALSKQKAFALWQTSDPQIEALGPGTHSWLVLFTNEGQNVGYMVVNAVTDGSFQLGEYGVGPYPLFSSEQLDQSLRVNGLLTELHQKPTSVTKLYVHPLAAAWQVTIGKETYWLDAKTAEILPINEQTSKLYFPKIMTLPDKLPASKRTQQLKLNPSFDPYERLPWLTKEAPFATKDALKLQKHLNKRQHLRYISEPFGDAMLYALSIVGYQVWNQGRIDLAIDMNGHRFIPLVTLQQYGRFYR
ncbi:MAG: hypothetical protein P0Y55_05370 [Candidatus Cohnella colombiensis]|uniref:DUF4309 domain-containing protein n=1 Tax=Candidatus Cohnella colombiensis TaxID=3121368 RepID=A0AA95EZE6_9BACL|nr:MAG: hypothetical protein P0Y55_05370 [Cohnella sp.]